MAATDYFEQLVLAHALLQQPFSIETWYAGLWLTNPTASGDLDGEVSAGDYVRKPVAFNSSFANSSVIDWAAAQSAWGEVDYMCFLNSPVVGQGNMLAFQSRATLDITVGLPVTIPVGGLTLTLV